jgi:prephenate dehydrogenase
VKPAEECTAGIVGLGLMGGAVAMALRKIVKGGSLLAHDIDEGVLSAAGGIIDEGFVSPERMLPRCDLVFLCLSPSALLRFMDRWMDRFRPGCLITDIAGVKGAIVEKMERELREDIDFIPGHPMAGSEGEGFARAGSCDFRGKNYILTPLRRNRPENLAFLKDLIRRMGFGRITETGAPEHDRKVAFSSQLCHVIAAALIDCEEDREITRFGGGSFEDLTRIALLNVPLWSELFLENRRELCARIGQFTESLDELKALIAEGAGQALAGRLALIRNRRAAMEA